MAVEKDIDPGAPYHGHSGIARKSPWLSNADLHLAGVIEITVKIAEVYRHPKVTLDGGRVEENMLSVEFVGKKRRLLLNATNRKSLDKMFTTDTGKWVGQTITLYVTQTRDQVTKQMVDCLRIRETASRPVSRGITRQPKPDPNAGTPVGTTAATAPPTAAGSEPADIDWPDSWGDDQVSVIGGAADTIGMPPEKLASIIEAKNGDFEAVRLESIGSPTLGSCCSAWALGVLRPRDRGARRLRADHPARARADELGATHERGGPILNVLGKLVKVLERLCEAIEDNTKSNRELTGSSMAASDAAFELTGEVSRAADALEQLAGSPGVPASAEITIGVRVPE